MRIRLATPDDAEAIRAIYNVEVTTTTHTFDLEPRTLEDQRGWLAERTGAYAAVVADTDDGVVGFASLSPYRTRAAYRTTVENSVFVHEAHRGRGVGRALLDELLSMARSHGFHTVIARIAGHNEASVALHEALGFELVGTEREVGRKFNRWIDVVELQRIL